MEFETGIIQSFFLIFTGAALLATAALYTRQPLLMAYVVIGCLLGPHGLGLVSDQRLLAEIAEIGIIFLLFLVGLDLPPAKLKNMAGKGLITALASTGVFYLKKNLLSLQPWISRPTRRPMPADFNLSPIVLK